MNNEYDEGMKMFDKGKKDIMNTTYKYKDYMNNVIVIFETHKNNQSLSSSVCLSE